MEAARSSETLVSTYKSKQRYLLEKYSPEDGGSTFLRTLVSTYKSKQRYLLEKHSPEDGGNTFLRNAGIYIQVQTALLPRKVQP
jgi:predicted metal-binding protein